MRWFADLPIERKLRVAIVIPAAVAFLIAMGVHTASQMLQFHKDVRERSAALAHFIGANTATAMKRADEKSETTLTLKVAKNGFTLEVVKDGKGTPTLVPNNRLIRDKSPPSFSI